MLLTLTAGKELEQADSGMDYVFVLDVSGSMANDGKLRLAHGFAGRVHRDARCRGPLRADDVQHRADAALPVAGRRPTPRLARPPASSWARSRLAAARCCGPRSRPPTATAIPTARSTWCVLSDGITEQREHQELLALIAQRPPGTRVFCIGVGNEVNRPLLEQLAEESGGLAAFISHGDDFERQAQAFRRKLHATRPPPA